MSFILEALAKSEEARRQTIAAPRFSLVPARETPVRERRVLPYLLVGALAVNGALLFVWASPTRFTGVAGTGKAAEAHIHTPTPPPQPPQPLRTESAVPEQLPPQAPARTQAPRVSTAPALPRESVRAAEIPEPSHTGLPAISVAGFIRDESAAGMVIVNDKLVHEGDEISPGLRLEKILPDGLVFDFKGQRFKR